jgi:hypothetical protein
MKEEQNMKHTMRILTFLMLAIVVGTGQTWGKLRGLGHIVCNEANVTGGTLTFYTDAACTDTKAITMTDGKSSNLSSEDLTAVMDGDNVIGYTVYIKAVPNYDYTLGAADDNGAVTFITAEKTTSIFQAPRRSSPDPTLKLGHDITVTATDERFVYSFTMPASGANVTVHVNFPEKPKNTAAVSYIDADGTTKTLAANTAYIIDGTESKMGTSNTDTWYVCTGDVAYTSSITLGGDVNLILADGCQMSATTISGSASQLTIYAQTGGQTGQTGQMVVAAYECGVAFGQRFVVYNAATGTAASAIVSGSNSDANATFTLDGIAGKTLRPLDGNYVIANPDVFTFSGSTSLTSPFDITTGEGENETTTHYYICKKEDPVTLSYAGSDFVMLSGLPEGTTLAAVEGQPMQRSFTMPAADVTLTTTPVTGLTAASVTYDGTAQVPVIKQVDDVFDAANYTIAYQLGDDVVTEAKHSGTYTCTMTGLGQYIGTTTVDFDITKRSTSLAVEIVDPETTVDGNPLIIACDDAHVKVTLVPVAGEGETNLPKINGIVKIFVGSKDYTVAIVNGEGHYYVSNMGQGAYDITASFAGDANHAASTSDPNYSIAVSNVKTALRICFDKTDMTANTKVVTVGEPVTVYVDLYTVPSDWDGDFAKASPFNSDAVLTVKCNPTWQTDTTGHGNYTVGLVNGHGSITFSHLAADECHYNIDAVYAGNDKYLQCQTMNGTEPGRKTLIMTVNKTATTVGVGVTSPVIAK